MGAATDALGAHVLAAQVHRLLDHVVFLVDEGGHGRERPTVGRNEARRLDVDMPTGETGGEAGVLAFLANGERKLIIGDDNRRVICLLYTSPSPRDA